MTRYDPDYSFEIAEDEKRYKYTQVTNIATLTDDGENITVKVDGYTVGVAPRRHLEDIRKIIAENPEYNVFCDITGGEYIERIGSKIDKGTDPYNVLVILRF